MAKRYREGVINRDGELEYIIKNYGWSGGKCGNYLIVAEAVSVYKHLTYFCDKIIIHSRVEISTDT